MLRHMCSSTRVNVTVHLLWNLVASVRISVEQRLKHLSTKNIEYRMMALCVSLANEQQY